MSKKLCMLVMLSIFALSCTAFATEKATIEYWHGIGSLEEANTVFRMLAVDYPEIKFVTQAVSKRGIADKMKLAIASGFLPNLIRDYNGRLTAWKFQGITIPLLDTLTEEEKADFYPGMLESHMINGDLFMYPQTYGPMVYLVNRDLLSDTGLSLPTDDFTFSQWMEMAQKVSDPPNTYAGVIIGKARGGDHYTLDYLQMFGANLYEEGNYTQTTLNSDAGVRALEWMLEMRDRGFIPSGIAGISSTDATNLMLKGQVLMFGGIVAFTTPQFWEKMIDSGRAGRVWDFAIVPKPHLASIPTPGLFIGSDGVSVFQEEDPKVLKAALRVAKTLLKPEYVAAMNIQSQSLSCRKSIRPEHVEKNVDYIKIAEWLARFGVGEQGINSPFYVEIRDLRVQEFQAAFMGTKTPKQALDDFAKAVEALCR